jgi:uncharacterized protein YukE
MDDEALLAWLRAEHADLRAAARAYVAAEEAYRSEVRAPEWEWEGRSGAKHQAELARLHARREDAYRTLVRLLSDGED